MINLTEIRHLEKWLIYWVLPTITCGIYQRIAYRSPSWLSIVGGLLFCLLFLYTPSFATAQGTSTLNSKTANYIISFPKFVTWPVNRASGEIIVGFVGGEEEMMQFREALDNTGNSTWVLQHLQDSSQLMQCSIVFFAEDIGDDTLIYLKQLKGTPILTIGNNLTGFCQKGGMINILGEKGAQKFEINVAQALDAGLDISSKLLAISMIVE